MPIPISIAVIVFELAGVKNRGFPFEMHMALTTLPCASALASDTASCAYCIILWCACSYTVASIFERQCNTPDELTTWAAKPVEFTLRHWFLLHVYCFLMILINTQLHGSIGDWSLPILHTSLYVILHGTTTWRFPFPEAQSDVHTMQRQMRLNRLKYVI